jgi:hypothetical protein
MDPLPRTCGKCLAALVIDNVIDGPGTNGYVVGCTKCGSDDSGGTIHSLTLPKAGN